MEMQVVLKVKAFQNDWRGLQHSEDRYAIMRNGVDMYDETFSLESANHIAEHGFEAYEKYINNGRTITRSNPA